MIDTNIKLELEDIRNIEAAYRWMAKGLSNIRPEDPSGRNEFLMGAQETLKKISLIESWTHFENNVDKILVSFPFFPKDEDIKYQRLEKYQYHINIAKNIVYWMKQGVNITKKQSGWELGYFKLKEDRSG